MTAAPRLRALTLALWAAHASSARAQSDPRPQEQPQSSPYTTEQVMDAWNRAAPVNSAVSDGMAGVMGGPGVVSTASGYLAQGLAALGLLGRQPGQPPAQTEEPELAPQPRETGGTGRSGPAAPSGPGAPAADGRAAGDNASSAYELASQNLAQQLQQRMQQDGVGGPGGAIAPIVPRDLNQGESRVAQQYQQDAPAAAPFDPSRVPTGRSVPETVIAFAASGSGAGRPGGYGTGDPAIVSAGGPAADGKSSEAAFGQARLIDEDGELARANLAAKKYDGASAHVGRGFDNALATRDEIPVAQRIGVFGTADLVPADPVCARRDGRC